MKQIKIIILSLLIFAAGCVAIYDPITGKKQYYIFDDKAEISWGEAIAQEFVRQNKMFDDKRSVSKLQQLGENIAQNSHRSNLGYRFYIIDEDTINAFAAPGGHIFVYRGLLDSIGNDQLAFVLAHEIAHVCARHSLKKLQANLGFMLLSSILLSKPNQEDAKNLTGQIFDIVSNGFSRKDEFQADSLAVDYVIKSGCNPKAAIDLFELFKEEESHAGPKAPFYLRTHPYPEDRIENVKKKIAQLSCFLNRKD